MRAGKEINQVMGVRDSGGPPDAGSTAVSRPVWAEVDLGAIDHNLRQVARRKSPQAGLMAVVKANAYGHGAVPVAETALAAGANWLGVAILGEAIELRRAGVAAPILILGYTPPDEVGSVLANDVSQAVFSMETARALSREAARLGRRARVHLKVDTGMSRLGVAPGQDGLAFAKDLAGLPGLDLEGIFTHFAAADDPDQGYTRWQLERFTAFIEDLRALGIEFRIRHAANSAAIINLPEAHLDLVRLGISLYGYHPSPGGEGGVALRPAMTVKARIGYLKEVPAGTCVSYGRTFVTGRPTVLATLPLGYADGYPRLLSSRGAVIIHGRMAPVVGRVCMDQIMVDVTDIPRVALGDEVIVLGRQGEVGMTADDLAALTGTISYEILCGVSPRVPRVYLPA
ncbi:MAG TPA: alanine racemase [Bacillota bacterium]